jgi:4-amino-4-deoxy-L-arabinose transferase-like glycosyltransferase
MSATGREILMIVGVAGLVFFTNLGGYPLFDEDEPKNAVCGKEMFARGDWIVPTFNEELRTDKPILIYWLMLCSYHLFGVSEFSARFGSSLLSIGTSLGTYLIGRKLYDRQVGLLAGIVVATCLMFSAVGRAVTPDATLVCCLTWCFVAYVFSLSEIRQETRGDRQEDKGIRDLRSPLASWPAPISQKSFGALSACYACMGLAMLAKGPVGFLLPCTAIGMFGLCRTTRDDLAAGVVSLGEGAWWRTTLRMASLILAPRRIAQSLLGMKLWLGVPIAFGIALPWYVAVGVQTDGAWLAGFLGGHNVKRFLQPMEQHRGLIIYYLPVLFAGTFPWSVFLPTAVRDVWQRIRIRAANSDADLFLSCWALTWLVFFSLAQTKLPNYILPIYPAVAVLIARSLVAWVRDLSRTTRRFQLECRAMAVVGAAAMVGVLIAMSILLPDETPLALLGAIPIVTAGTAYYFAVHQQRPRAVISLAAGAVALSLVVTGLAPLQLARYQDSPFFAGAAHQAAPFGTPEIATFDVFEPSLVFYHGRKIHRPNVPQDVATFFEAHPDGFVLTRSDRIHRLPSELSDGLVEIARQKRFLRRHDLVLLGRPQVIAAGHRETH